MTSSRRPRLYFLRWILLGCLPPALASQAMAAHPCSTGYALLTQSAYGPALPHLMQCQAANPTPTGAYNIGYAHEQLTRPRLGVSHYDTALRLANQKKGVFPASKHQDIIDARAIAAAMIQRTVLTVEPQLLVDLPPELHAIRVAISASDASYKWAKSNGDVQALPIQYADWSDVIKGVEVEHDPGAFEILVEWDGLDTTVAVPNGARHASFSLPKAKALLGAFALLATDCRSARALFEKHLTEFPQSKAALWGLAKCGQRQEDWDATLRSLRRLETALTGDAASSHDTALFREVKTSIERISRMPELWVSPIDEHLIPVALTLDNPTTAGVEAHRALGAGESTRLSPTPSKARVQCLEGSAEVEFSPEVNHGYTLRVDRGPSPSLTLPLTVTGVSVAAFAVTGLFYLSNNQDSFSSVDAQRPAKTWGTLNLASLVVGGLATGAAWTFYAVQPRGNPSLSIDLVASPNQLGVSGIFQ